MTWLFVGLSLLGIDPQERQADVRDKLAAEREALEALRSEKKDALAALDTAERAFREARTRLRALERTSVMLRTAQESAARKAAASESSRQSAEAALSPRLRALSRIKRSEKWSALLSAKDFSTLLKRTFGVSRLVAQDLTALEDAAALATVAKLEASRAERVLWVVGEWALHVRVEEAQAQATEERFRAVLARLSTQSAASAKLVADLERADAELERLVSKLQQSERDSLRARKGRLPYPVQGTVEVPFGKVVNPRFNTVTFQKGIDLRAPKGSPVSAVAAGSVVFAGWLKGYGNLVIIDHGSGYHTLLGHLDDVEVEVGNEVEEGETVGTLGDTGSLKGAYLYFEIRKRGEAVDPLPWLDPQASP